MLRWLDIIRLRLRSLVRRERLDTELDRELRGHLEQQVDEFVGRGMSRDDAVRIAASTFGGMQRVREEARDARGTSLFENIARDLRYALRGLRREPMLLVAATISIAVGAGSNLAVYTLAREFVFATPDVREPDAMVQFQVSHGSHASYQRWLDIDASGALAGVAGYSYDKEINWRNGDVTSSLVPMLVTANFFDVTGVPVFMGRGFRQPEAAAESGTRVALVSHPFWRTTLNADPAVLGRQIMLNGESYTIIGVLAPNLRSVAGFAIAPSVYVPLNRSLVPELETPNAAIVRLVGRLKPGQSLDQGRLAVDAVDRRLGRLQGDSVYAGVQMFAPIGSFGGPKATRVIGGFFTLLALVSLMVLLIACANVAGLLIARGTRRRQEIAIRLAIGGTRSRLLQQFLIEGFWLALLGTAGGMVLSFAFMRFVNGISLPVPLPVELQLAPDFALFMVAVGIIFLSIVCCAVLPAIGATRLALVPALKKEEPIRTGRRLTARGVLLVGQVTVSTVLLVTAFLFLRNMARTQVTNPGFEVERALVAQVGFVRGQPNDQQLALLERAVERVAALPGVEQAAYSNAVPLTMYSGSSNGMSAFIDDRPSAQHVEFSRSHVGPGYFGTLGVRLLAGREFQPMDRRGAPPVAIVNAEFARRYFEGRNPVGSRLRFQGRDTTYDIVGMVANGKHQTLGEEQRGAFYLPLAQGPEDIGIAFVLARTRSDAAALAAPVREALGTVDQSVAIEVRTMRSALTFAMLPSRIGATVLGSLGALGLILAAFGLYALVSYTVSRRFGEIAIRSALGASQARILRLITRDAAVLVGTGITLGLAISALVTAPLSRFLVTGLSSRDPMSFIGTALAFIVVGVLASWLPARSAVRVSPVIAMRQD
jgi:putative ABC transport system permease protein